MNVFFSVAQHFDELHLLPLLALGIGRCENEDCGAIHGLRLTVGWLLWSVALTIEWD